jgi:hypothetical protein
MRDKHLPFGDEIKMKRFIVFVVPLVLASWFVAQHRRSTKAVAVPPREWQPLRHVHKGHGVLGIASGDRRHTERALAEARQAVAEVRSEVRDGVDEGDHEMRHALDQNHLSMAPADDANGAVPAETSPRTKRESVEGLPVPIVPGTRVTEAVPQPPVSGVATALSKKPAGLSILNASPTSKVAGELSATAERATANACLKLSTEVVKWLNPDVPSTWTCPQRLLDTMVLQTRIEPHAKNYGTVYVAELTVDSSLSRRAGLIDAYNRELLERRMAALVGTLAFVLVCLAVVSGYIRADEATKGYYTHRLRMLAAAGVGAAGAIIYHMIV